MLKEAVLKRFDEAILRSRQFGLHRGLKPEGKPHFDQLIKDYKEGKQILFYKYIHMLDGYDYTSNIHGLENLQEIKDELILVVANHPYEDPLLGGHCQRILINHNVHLITGKETHWLFGEDKTTPERFMRKRFLKQSSLIPVRDDDPETSRTLIMQAFRNKDTFGINPEGDGNKTLLRAVPGAAKMIIASVLRNYNIICVTTGFENGTFFMTVDSPLDNGRIRQIRSVLKGDEEKLQQLISDYAMARIAKHLPEEKRGYYHNFQDFISAFEELTVE